ncbi:MAG: glycosyltransferase family 4 protein [Candidatus Doudnabacteria bacterium]|nr:glycosyltransferase family 4 protein [Candidatus Doudnabacteria bacterium]
MKTALVHDSITQLGGAERVLEALHELYPEAPIFTLVYDQKLKEHFEGWTIVSSPLQYLYNIIPRFQWMLPFIPIALKFFDFSKFDLVISSSSVFAKNITVPKGVIHIDYCHSPARFLWSESESYVHDEVPWLLRPIVKVFLTWMRKWDYQKAQQVDFFIANSDNIQKKIKLYYKRESLVIHPCIDAEKFYPSMPKEDYFLIAARLQIHKRIDLAIEAFNQLGIALHVVGTGRDEQRLKNMANEKIVFLGRVEDPILCNEYSAAKGFIFPQDEDFGLTPLEANAAGTAVIAYKKGGALETVIENKTGIFFDKLEVESLKDAVRKFNTINFNSEDLFEQADKFSKDNFKAKFEYFVNEKIK